MKKRLFSLLGAFALSNGQTNAQLTYFYSDSGSGANSAAGGVASDGTLDSIGFDMWTSQVGRIFPSGIFYVTPTSDEGSARVLMRNPSENMWEYLNIAATGLNPPSGYIVDSITLYFFVETVAHDGNYPATYQVYQGLDRGRIDGSTGSQPSTLLLQSFSLSDANEESFISLTLDGDQFANGISIGVTSTLTPVFSTFATEENGVAFRTPGLSVTYVPIPEPSSLLLGGLASFILFRRKRPLVSLQ